MRASAFWHPATTRKAESSFKEAIAAGRRQHGAAGVSRPRRSRRPATITKPPARGRRRSSTVPICRRSTMARRSAVADARLRRRARDSRGGGGKWPADTRFTKPLAMLYATFGRGREAVRTLERYLDDRQDDRDAYISRCNGCTPSTPAAPSFTAAREESSARTRMPTRTAKREGRRRRSSSSGWTSWIREVRSENRARARRPPRRVFLCDLACSAVSSRADRLPASSATGAFLPRAGVVRPASSPPLSSAQRPRPDVARARAAFAAWRGRAAPRSCRLGSPSQVRLVALGGSRFRPPQSTAVGSIGWFSYVSSTSGCGRFGRLTGLGAATVCSAEPWKTRKPPRRSRSTRTNPSRWQALSNPSTRRTRSGVRRIRPRLPEDLLDVAQVHRPARARRRAENVVRPCARLPPDRPAADRPAPGCGGLKRGAAANRAERRSACAGDATGRRRRHSASAGGTAADARFVAFGRARAAPRRSLR